MTEEMIEEVDCNDNTIQIVPKTELKKRVFFYRNSLIIPKTFNNQFIIAKRAENKFPYPGVWCCGIGGGVKANESYEDAALREMIEESGFSTELSLVSNFVYDTEIHKAIFQVFTTKEVIPIEQLIPEEKEIQYFKSFSLEEIDSMIKENPSNFAPTFIKAFYSFKENL